MGTLSAVYENKILDAFIGDGRAAGMPATVYVALFVGDPEAGGVEVSGGAYVRQSKASTNANWPAAANSQKSNATTITFPEATASWGTPTHFALMDAVAAGNRMVSGALGTARPIAVGERAQFDPNTLVISAS